MILRLTVISSKQLFRYNKMYKSNLDPGKGNAKDGVRRTPSFLNMYVPGFSEKVLKKSFENDFVDKWISLN